MVLPGTSLSPRSKYTYPPDQFVAVPTLNQYQPQAPHVEINLAPLQPKGFGNAHIKRTCPIPTILIDAMEAHINAQPRSKQTTPLIGGTSKKA